MKLYDWKIAPNPRRVRIFLAEKGIEVPVEQVGEADKPKLKPEFLTRNSHRRVPLLELDDGTEIGEAMAICRYFEALQPEPPLFGTNSLETALIEMWERKIVLDGMAPISESFRNKAPVFAGRALPGYRQEIPQIPEIAERSKIRVPAFYRDLDGQLAENDYIAGNAYSVADITGLCAIDVGINARFPVDGYANIQRWHETVSARPSAKA